MRPIAALKRRAKTSLRFSAFHSNHLFKKYHPTLWVIGDGRSGTTWLTSLINADKHFREIFEPFHPDFVRQMGFLRSHQYMKPRTHLYVRSDEENKELHESAKLIFEGKFWSQWSDIDNPIGLFGGLLVKDIFANLFSNWVYKNFPHIKIVLLVRNPFAVALSKYRKKDWKWVTDPMTMYYQQNLKEDYLYDHEDLIRRISREEDYILRQILIWSIIHYIPFKQFSASRIQVIFYENVIVNPKLEISSIRVDKEIELPQNVIHKPSKVVGDNVAQGKSPINSWLNDLTPKTIDEGMKILESFGLENLYKSNSLPNSFDIDQYK